MRFRMDIGLLWRRRRIAARRQEFQPSPAMRADAAQLGQERPQLVEELDDVAADQPVELLAEDGDPALDVVTEIDHRRACGWWRSGKACLRSDDADEDRHCHHRGSAARLTIDEPQ